MKMTLPLLAFAALAISSCTSAYKTGQTPDDVYYSPVRAQDEYVDVEKRDDRVYRGSEEYYEDRFLRYRVQNRYRWSTLDDYYFSPSYSSYYYGGYNNWYGNYNSYHCWNNYYNPYYGGVVIIKNPSVYVPPSKPLTFNPNNYTPNNNNRRSVNLKNGTNNNGSRYNNSNSFGNQVRKIFSSGSSGNNSNSSSGSSVRTYTPTRSYTPSSSGSSGGRSSSTPTSTGGGGRPSR